MPRIIHIANNNPNRELLQFVKRRGLVTIRDVRARGIHPEYVRRLHKSGKLTRVGRGVYALAGSAAAGEGVAQISKRIPNGVICLLSALQIHRIGTQSPHEIWVAIDRKAARPKIEYPPVRILRLSGAALIAGVEAHSVEGVRVKVFGVAKTVADCFKYRNKVGLDVAIEALRDALRQRKCTIDEIWKFATICRITKVIQPYLEATA